MKNPAFAVDPCPRDLLGKQWLFMHMSSHYRRMWSAQSIVDCAPPASLKARASIAATPRSARVLLRSSTNHLSYTRSPLVPIPIGPHALSSPHRCPPTRRPHTAVDYADGTLVPPLSPVGTPRAMSASTPTRRSARTSATGAPMSSDAVVQRVLQRQSLRGQRSAQFRHVKAIPPPASGRWPVRLSQKPSRADTDPGSAAPTLDGRASSASASGSRRRHFEYCTSTVRRLPNSLARPPRRDLPATYYDKLNHLVPDHMIQRSAPRTSGLFLSEVFTPPVPHKPQVLRTEVPSRLRFSSTYCPPRPRTLRSKLGVAGQEMSKDTEQSLWTAPRSSPPVSSRDSAYNGGISSGGESRGGTPDQKGSRKVTKRSEKKSGKKVEPKKPHSVDARTRRKLENKLKKKLLEDERKEIQDQRLRVDPWHGINHDDHSNELSQNIDSLHIDSQGNDSLTEHENHEVASLSDQSVEEDMGEGADETVDEDMEDEVDETVDVDEEGDSLIIDGSSAKPRSSASEESVKSLSSSKTSTHSNSQQVGTQSSLKVNGPNITTVMDRLLENSSPSQSVHTSRTSSKQSTSDHEGGLSESSNKQLIKKIFSNEIGGKHNKSHIELEDKQTSLPSNKNSDFLRRQELPDMIKKDTNEFEFKSSLKEGYANIEQTKFLNAVTKTILERGIHSYRGLQAVCNEHMEASCNKLDRATMKNEVDKLHRKLKLPQSNYLDSTSCEDYVDRIKNPLTSEVPQLLWDKQCLSPLISQPAQAPRIKLSDPHDPNLKLAGISLFSAEGFEGVLESQSKSILTTEEGLRAHESNNTLEKLFERKPQKGNVEKPIFSHKINAKFEETSANLSENSNISTSMQVDQTPNAHNSNASSIAKEGQKTSQGGLETNGIHLIQSHHLLFKFLNPSNTDWSSNSFFLSSPSNAESFNHVGTTSNQPPTNRGSDLKERDLKDNNNTAGVLNWKEDFVNSEEKCRNVISSDDNTFKEKWMSGESTISIITEKLSELLEDNKSKIPTCTVGDNADLRTSCLDEADSRIQQHGVKNTMSSKCKAAAAVNLTEGNGEQVFTIYKKTVNKDSSSGILGAGVNSDIKRYLHEWEKGT